MIKTGNRAGPDFLKVNITLKSGEELSVEKENIRGDSIQFSDASSDSGTFSIGYATMKTFTFAVSNLDNQYSRYDFEDAVVFPYVINNGRNYLKGRYGVYEPKIKGRTIELVCYDSMYDTEKEYSTDLTFPATLGRIMQECSIKCGFVLANSSFPNDDVIVQEKPNVKTWRQLIGYIAQCAGCYARFNVRDELELKGYDRNAFSPSDNYDGGHFDQTSARRYQSGDSLDGGDFTFSESQQYDGGTLGSHIHHNIFRFKSTEIAAEDTVITGISIKTGDMEYIYGSKDYMLQIQNNPLITPDNVQRILTSLVNGYIGLRFRKMTVTCLGDFSVEAGDPACLWDAQNKEYHCYITNLSYKLNGPMSLSNAAEVKKKNNSSPGGTVTKLLDLADKGAEKKVSEYKQMQEYFNNLALNMLGMYYFTELDEEGAEIHYGSNTPDIKDSTYAWKDGSKGFFISKDGGKTWTYGRDSDGNVVANVLAAVGIVAQWINTRGLKAADNDGNITFEVEALTGHIRMNCTEFSLTGKSIEELAQEANKKAIETVANDLKGQIDGKIETYNQSTDPSVSWKTVEVKAQHMGDLWYWEDVTKRWNGTKWETLPSSDDEARKLAKSKRRIFVTQPVPPYDEGDLWTQGENGDIMSCAVSRTSGTYVKTDWKKSSNYIDYEDAEKAAGEAVSSQTQEDIFNRLTNGGATQGVFLSDGKIYINFTYARGGTLKLGGTSNGNGTMEIYDAGNSLIGKWNNGGFVTKGRLFSVSESGQMYSNSPVAITYLYMAGSVSNLSNVEIADRTKAKALTIAYSFSGGGSSTGYTGEYALYIGNSETADNWKVTSADAYVPFTFRKKVTVTGDLAVSGSKSRLAETENYGERLLYCYEMPSPMFGDIGEGETDDTGKCYIYLDDKFAETVAAGMEYQVFLQKEGPGDLWIEKKMSFYFVVSGTPGLKFAWEIKARQKGYECERLEDTVDRSLDGRESPEGILLKELEQAAKEREEILYGS